MNKEDFKPGGANDKDDPNWFYICAEIRAELKELRDKKIQNEKLKNQVCELLGALKEAEYYDVWWQVQPAFALLNKADPLFRKPPGFLKRCYYRFRLGNCRLR